MRACVLWGCFPPCRPGPGEGRLGVQTYMNLEGLVSMHCEGCLKRRKEANRSRHERLKQVHPQSMGDVCQHCSNKTERLRE